MAPSADVAATLSWASQSFFSLFREASGIRNEVWAHSTEGGLHRPIRFSCNKLVEPQRDCTIVWCIDCTNFAEYPVNKSSVSMKPLEIYESLWGRAVFWGDDSHSQVHKIHSFRKHPIKTNCVCTTDFTVCIATIKLMVVSKASHTISCTNTSRETRETVSTKVSLIITTIAHASLCEALTLTESSQRVKPKHLHHHIVVGCSLSHEPPPV